MLFLIIMEFGELTLSVLPQLGRWRYIISYLKGKKHPAKCNSESEPTDSLWHHTSSHKQNHTRHGGLDQSMADQSPRAQPEG